MIARAIAKYIRISPKKARLVAGSLRRKPVGDALSMLMNINKKASEIVGSVIESAASNAKMKYPDKKYTEDDLYISKITIDEGPALVRYRAASMGRASMVKKRTSHILVELDVNPKRKEQKVSKQKEAKKQKSILKKPILARKGSK